MRTARQSVLPVSAAIVAAFGVLAGPACSSFDGTTPEPTPDAAADGTTTDASAQDGNVTPAFAIGCGSASCVGPDNFCCFPPSGGADTTPRCEAMESACTGDYVAVHCDEPSDCPPNEACCVTSLDGYRVGSATCRKSCGEGDAGATDIRLCSPKTASAQHECPKGDCVALAEANRKITGGAGIQITSGLFGCDAN